MLSANALSRERLADARERLLAAAALAPRGSR